MIAAATLLLATSLPPNTLSVGAGGCLCVSEEKHYENSIKYTGVGHVRLQYDRALFGALYVGATAAGEWISSNERDARAGLLGGVIGLRAGNVIRGGVRLAVGGMYAYSFDALERTPRNANAFGWFVDTSADVAVRLGKSAELFLDLSIFNMRTLYNRDTSPWGKTSWFYVSPLLPTMATVGARFSF